MRHRRATILAAVAVVSAACTESVDQEAPAQSSVIASYSSPNIPTPNDFALAAASAAAIPPLPDGPGKQFLQSLIAQGGFPADQAPTLTVPIRAVTYDAATGRYVEAEKPTVDVATVTPGDVRALQARRRHRRARRDGARARGESNPPASSAS